MFKGSNTGACAVDRFCPQHDQPNRTSSQESTNKCQREREVVRVRAKTVLHRRDAVTVSCWHFRLFRACFAVEHAAAAAAQ